MPTQNRMDAIMPRIDQNSFRFTIRHRYQLIDTLGPPIAIQRLGKLDLAVARS